MPSGNPFRILSHNCGEKSEEQDLLLLEEREENMSCRGRHEHQQRVIQLYLDEIGRIPPLTHEEELALAARLPHDEAARHRMIEGHLPLVIEMAKEFVKPGRPSALKSDAVPSPPPPRGLQ